MNTTTSLTDNTEFVAFDTELTGLNERKDTLLSIGAIRMSGGTIHLGDHFERLIKPSSPITPQSVIIHQITPADVLAEEPAHVVLRDFFEFCGKAILVGHFAQIDLEFIQKESKQILEYRLVDTVSLLRWLQKHTSLLPFRLDPKTNLFDVAKSFDIDINGAHTALGDAYITAQIFQRLLPLLSEGGIVTLEQLFKVGKTYQGGDDPTY